MEMEGYSKYYKDYSLLLEVETVILKVILGSYKTSNATFNDGGQILLHYTWFILMAIPSNPSLNEEWTNDVTGVTYKWDGERWYIVSTLNLTLEEKYVKKWRYYDR